MNTYKEIYANQAAIYRTNGWAYPSASEAGAYGNTTPLFTEYNYKVSVSSFQEVLTIKFENYTI